MSWLSIFMKAWICSVFIFKDREAQIREKVTSYGTWVPGYLGTYLGTWVPTYATR